MLELADPVLVWVGAPFAIVFWIVLRFRRVIVRLRDRMVSATNSNNLKLKEVENLASDGKMAEAYSLIVGLVVKNTVRHTLFGAQFLPNSVWNWLENGAAALAMNAWRGKSPKEPEQSGTDAATDKAAAPQGLTGPPELDSYTKRMLDLIGIATGWAELWEFLQNIFCVAGFLAAVLAAYMFLLYPAILRHGEEESTHASK